MSHADNTQNQDAYSEPGYVEDDSMSDSDVVHQEMSGATSATAQQPEAKKKTSNLPYIAAAGALTLAFGGFMAYKFIGGSAPTQDPMIGMHAQLQQPNMAPDGMPAQAPLVGSDNMAPPPSMDLMLTRSPEVQGAMYPQDSMPQSASQAPGYPSVSQVDNANNGAQATYDQGAMLAQNQPVIATNPVGNTTPSVGDTQAQPMPPPQLAPAQSASTPDQGVTANASAEDVVKITQQADQDTEKAIIVARIKEVEDQTKRIESRINEIFVLLKDMTKVQSVVLAQKQEDAKKKSSDEKRIAEEKEARPAAEKKRYSAVATKSTRNSNNQVKKEVVTPSVDYKLFALRSDKAWLRAPDGSTVIVGAGDTLPGAGVVKEINIHQSAVVLTSGVRIAI